MILTIQGVRDEKEVKELLEKGDIISRLKVLFTVLANLFPIFILGKIDRNDNFA